MTKKNASKNPTANTTTKEITTMKKTPKKTATLAPATIAPASTPVATTAAAPPDIPTQLQAIENACGYGDPLPDVTRKTSEKLIARVPSTIVDHVITLATRGGGEVAGIKLDPDAANAALAQADEADAVATAALMLARRAQDQSIRLRSGLTGTVSAIRTSLRGYVKTAQGASLAQANDELRTLAKQHQASAKARKTRVENAMTASTTPPPTPAEAPVAEPVASAPPASAKTS